MYTRRRALALGAGGLAALSGCAGAADLATGNGPIERTASPAVLAEAALDDTAYELTTRTERTLEREVSAGGETRTIVATNQLTFYEKALDAVAGGSLFGVLSTPAFSFVGQPLNPIADRSNAELLPLLAGVFGELSDVRNAGTRTETVLGTDTTISTFDATATVAGRAIDTAVHTTSVVNDGDVVVVTAGYPQAVEATEAATVAGFFPAIEHPVEP